MKNSIFYFFAFVFVFQSCIGDDVIFDTVEPEIRITNPIDSIEINTAHQFSFAYFNNIGQAENNVEPFWKSSNPSVISIEQDGTAFAANKGAATISVEYIAEEKLVIDSIQVGVGKETVVTNTNRSGTIKTTSSYRLQGDFTIEDNGTGGVNINFAGNFDASTALPGLYVYLTNNPNTTSGAKEIQKVTVFNGAHSIEVQDVGVSDYSHILYFCKPFNVKVGDGEIE